MKARCPSCRHVMTIDDAASGTPNRCSQCWAVLGMPKPAKAARREDEDEDAFADEEIAGRARRRRASEDSDDDDDEDDDDLPRRRRRRRDMDARAGSGGLSGLTIAGIVCLVIGVFCVLPAGVAMLRVFRAARAVQENLAAMPMPQENGFAVEQRPVEWIEEFKGPDMQAPAINIPRGLENDERVNAFIAKNLAPNNQVGPLAPDSPLWAKIKRADEQNKLTASLLKGGGFGNADFRDTAPPGGVLIGFFACAPNDAIVNFVQPIYLTAQGEQLGQRYGERSDWLVCVKAKPGYAVGAIHVRTGGLLDSFRVTFMKVEGEKLNPNDAYDSIQIGGNGGGPGRADGGGALIVGIHGRRRGNPQIAPDGSITGLGVLSLK